MERFKEQIQNKMGIQLIFLANQNFGPTQASQNPDLGQPIDPTLIPRPTSPTAMCSLEERGVKQVVRKLHRLNKKKNPNVITVPPPEGTPLFLFQPIEGINRPVNVFYDKGCSHAVFRTDIPKNELNGSKLNSGPFEMGGVGDIRTIADDEWIVQVSYIS